MNICEIACLECKKTEKSKKKSQLCRVPALGKAGHFSQQSPALPSAGVALGKVTKPLPSASTRQRFFSKKNAECLTRQHSAKIFSKKKFLCRVPDTSALGKGCRQVDGAHYCNVPPPRGQARLHLIAFLEHRLPSQTNNSLFCALCPHSCAPGRTSRSVTHRSKPSTLNLRVLKRWASRKEVATC